MWIAHLLHCGLLRGSYVPARAYRELRDLSRHRTTLVQQHTQTVNRLHAVLQDANIKLSSVASNILGVSGRDMIDALQQGEEDPTPTRMGLHTPNHAAPGARGHR